MSRDPYASSAGGNRSPRTARRVGELPTVDRSPSRNYPTHVAAGSRGSPLGRKSGGRPTRSGNTSPDHVGGYSSNYGPSHVQSHQPMSSPYYREDDLGSPIMMDDRGRSVGISSGGHHRSRSASRPAIGSSNPMSTRYQSLDRAGGTMGDGVGHEREFMPIREPRERSLDRVGARERSLERGLYLEDELYGGHSRSARQSPNPHMMSGGRDAGGVYIGELQNQNNDLQRELGNFKKELELTNQKLGSSMHSIKTFWSPELKKERALRKEESAKYSLINDQLKLLNSENQKQAMLVRQLEEELRLRMRNPSMEMQQQMEVLFSENEHLTREISILRETIKELELRIETQKQTLQARDESIKKLLEMLQNKGVGGNMLDHEEKMEFATMQARLIESENKMQHYESLMRDRDQELGMTERELKATNETLRALQMQLEKQLHSQNPGVPSNSTLAAILETKDARIVTLEKEVQLLENELDRIRECAPPGAMQGARDVNHSIRISSPIPDMGDHSTSLSRNDYSYKRQLDEFRGEIQRRDQEIMAMSAKMKTLEEQHQDYQRHIAVLKESLCAKEEHYNMLQADVEELRQRLDEKNRHIEKKTMTASQATQERNRLNSELNELRDHMDIKDRKINVLQRKLDLRDANKRLTNGAVRAGEETSALKLQLEEQKKQLEEQRRKLDEHKKGLDTKSRQLEEKQKLVADAEQKMKQRKEKLDQMEAQIQKNAASGPRGAGGNDAETQKRLSETEKALEGHRKELDKAKEDAQRSQVEMERLLQLVQMSQEEQNSKEKMIRDLQDALKNAQTKLRGQQNANAQMPKPAENNATEETDVGTIRDLRQEIQRKDSRVLQLEQDVRELEDVLIDHGKVGEVQSLKEDVQCKGTRLAELEKMIKELENALKNGEKGSDVSVTLKTKLQQIDKLQEEVNKKESKIGELEKVVDDLVAALKENETFNCSLLDDKDNDEVHCLKEEVEKKGLRICELELEVDELETALREHGNIVELEELMGLVKQKEDRIEELSEALRQSVRITADREDVLRQEESRRKQIMEKVGKLEQRLLSLQTAHALRCSTCRPLLTRMQELERRLTQLLAERRGHLQDLMHMKQEALESAISEKDAHLALLEVSGIRTARQSEEVDQLRGDRKRLMDRLKAENEKSVILLQEFADPASFMVPALLDMDDEEEDLNNGNSKERNNCHSLNTSEIDQDSLEDNGLNMTI